MFHKHKWVLRARIACKPYSGPEIEVRSVPPIDVMSLIQGQVILVFTCSCGKILEKRYLGSEVKLEEGDSDA